MKSAKLSFKRLIYMAALSAIVCVFSVCDPSDSDSSEDYSVSGNRITEQEYSASGAYVYFIEDTAVGIIEVYVLGAGGGGQGGDKKENIIDGNYNGTGGGGGGGAAAYMKLAVDRSSLPVTLSITVGKGGEGGGYVSKGGGTPDESGLPGSMGGSSSVRWESKSVNLSVEGGAGGGGNGTSVSGGAGGRADEASLPYGKAVYKKGKVSAGKNGANGSLKSDIMSEGGKAAELSIGSSSHFGGGNGGRRTSGGVTGAQNGGGGSGGYSNASGARGGDGMVYIILSTADGK